LKFHHFVFVLAVFTLTNCALAQTAAAGQVEGILDYCVRVSPNLAPQVVAFKRSLSQDAPHTNPSGNLALKEFRPYVGSYEAVQLALSKVPKSQVVSACTSALGSVGTHDEIRKR
jgi:hypothetical protein